MAQPSRRQFLATAGLLAAAGHSATGLGALAQTEDASSLIAGKDKRLLVLVSYPAVLETPLNLLIDEQITSKSLLFVRNNQQPDDAATLAPSPAKEWSIKVTGAVNKSFTITLSALREMEMSEYEMVLQCSGNGRSLFSKASQTSGTQWGKGGMGNVRFKGVKLSTVFEKNGIELNKDARFVLASGTDEALPGKEDFLHSLPATEVLNRSFLALDLNGEPISAIHGGPVRLITPGVYATMNVKWLSELNFGSEESTNYNHAVRYRVPKQSISPGTDYDFTLKNSTYNWNMKVKSVLLNPTDGSKLKAGETTIQGVAFNDGLSKIASVFVSVDRGISWQRAALERSPSLFGWTRFSTKVNLPVGRHFIWCRALDEFGRTQPLDGSIAWNPRGYEWNGIENVAVEVV